MLSKSQAKWFLIAATVGFSLVFLLLTVDTIRQVGDRTNEDALTAEVDAGRKLWDQKNCMGCHTLLGEGAYYAPELTQVVERRGEAWIQTFMADPEAMFPDRRKMPNYGFTTDEVDELIAFLSWISKIDTNDWPPEPTLGQSTAVNSNSVAAIAAAPSIYGDVCQACHSVAGDGGNIGPALDGVSQRYTEPELADWLADPQGTKPGTAMPNLDLDATTIDELVQWLQTLD